MGRPKKQKSNRLSTSMIKLRPYTVVKLAKRLDPLPGLSNVVLQLLGSKNFEVIIGTKNEWYQGIRFAGGERLPLQIDEQIFRELHFYLSIEHPDYRLDFNLKGKEWRDHRLKYDQLTQEAKKTMRINLTVMQIANSGQRMSESPQLL